MNLVCRDFSHSVFDCQEWEEPAWVLHHLFSSKEARTFDGNRRKKLESIIKGFEKYVQPKLPQFTRGVIHVDPHWSNPIVHI